MNAHSFNLQNDDVGEYCSFEEILQICYRCRARTRGMNSVGLLSYQSKMNTIKIEIASRQQGKHRKYSHV